MVTMLTRLNSIIFKFDNSDPENVFSLEKKNEICAVALCHHLLFMTKVFSDLYLSWGHVFVYLRLVTCLFNDNELTEGRTGLVCTWGICWCWSAWPRASENLYLIKCIQSWPGCLPQSPAVRLLTTCSSWTQPEIHWQGCWQLIHRNYGLCVVVGVNTYIVHGTLSLDCPSKTRTGTGFLLPTSIVYQLIWHDKRIYHSIFIMSFNAT